jgi:hypothetical protein
MTMEWRWLEDDDRDAHLYGPEVSPQSICEGYLWVGSISKTERQAPRHSPPPHPCLDCMAAWRERKRKEKV